MKHSAVLLTCIKISNGFQAFVLSNFEWPLKKGFTVYSTELKLSPDLEIEHSDLVHSVCTYSNVFFQGLYLLQGYKQHNASAKLLRKK